MKILVTAGATWVKIDDVRILTNRFTGKTGLYLASELKKKGHSVTLVINPHCVGKVKGLKTIYYHHFKEFKERLSSALKNNKYDAVIHTAAVSDYKIKNTFRGKIPSRKKSLTLSLVPTEKVIKMIRRLAKNAVLIQFKLQPGRRTIIEKAYKSLKENRSDFAVANALEDVYFGYRAFLIDREKNITTIDSKKALVTVLDKTIRSKKTK